MPLIRNTSGNVIANLEDRKSNVLPKTNAIQARLDDLARITKWLASPAGLKFASKQALLRSTGKLDSFSREGVLNAAGRGTADAASAIAVILAQVPLNGTGTHYLFDELSNLAFKNDTTYTGNRNAANEAKYRGTIVIKAQAGRKNDPSLTTYYNSDPLRKKGEDVYDSINSTVFTKKSGTQEDVYREPVLHPDLVPFYFNILGIENGFAKTINTLQFRGFFDGSLTDTFNGTWSNINYVGRGENLYTYQNFRRSLSFSFQTAAFASSELEVVTQKLNVLASLTAPQYSLSGFMKGTMVNLTIGDYVTRLPGIVEGVTITTDFNSSWEITPGKVLPMLAKVSVQFTPIHETIPTTTLGHGYEEGTPFIGGKYDFPNLDSPQSSEEQQ